MLIINEDIEKYVDNSIKEGLEVCIVDLSKENIDIREKALSFLANGDSIAITDNPGAAAVLKEMELPVIGYQHPGQSEYITSTEYIVEELSEVEEDYFNLAYARKYGIPLVIAETERTVIREMTEQDIPELFELYQDERVAGWVEPLYGYQEELEFTRAYIKNMYGFYGYGLWLVFDKISGKLIGRAGISNRVINGEERQELGYVIAGDYQRKGIGYEVSQAVLDYAREKLDLKEMFLCVEKNNEASIALAVKLGFELWGQCDNTFIMNCVL